MMLDFAYFAGLVAAAICFALLEIQIEGPDGWAANLPTWRLKNTLLNRLFPGRPLTGYHLWMLVFIAIVAHIPFTFGLHWTWRAELKAVSFILIFWVIEDFAWFLFNPAYGIARFRPQFIAWHQKAWWWIAPRDYWIATAIGIVLYSIARQEPPLLQYVAAVP